MIFVYEADFAATGNILPSALRVIDSPHGNQQLYTIATSLYSYSDNQKFELESVPRSLSTKGDRPHSVAAGGVRCKEMKLLSITMLSEDTIGHVVGYFIFQVSGTR